MNKKKFKIAVLGSTGSIGVTSLKIMANYEHFFNIELLVCNKNYKKILTQIKKFLPRYVYINNSNIREIVKKKKFKKKIIFFNSFEELCSVIENKKIKFDKVIHGISSFTGINFMFKFINNSKEILVANKESIICGGNVLLNKADKVNCLIRSIDSEHYCITELLKSTKLNDIDEVYITASGGPFLEIQNKSKLKSSVHKVLKHPTWSMGKKISVDSANMINKIFEVLEAHILFKIPLKKIKIKIHKESLVHCAIICKNGLVKMIMHDTSMEIPIRNCLLDNTSSKGNLKFKQKNAFHLTFDEKNISSFDIFKVYKNIINSGHAGWIVFNVINDILVEKFLKKEIFFFEITKKLIKIFSNSSLLRIKKIKIKSITDIKNTINFSKNLSNLI